MISRAFLIVSGLLIASCVSTPFAPSTMDSVGFLERSIVERSDGISISVAVPDAGEVQSLLGLDLYGKGIQPVWLQIDNQRADTVRVALFSIDDEYFSPLEVAWYFRKNVAKDSRSDLERWIYEQQMPRKIPPGESRSGFVFTHRVDGTKGFNVDVYARRSAYNFTFFVPMPGFQADYMDVQFASLYAPDEIVDLSFSEIEQASVNFRCCSTDASGTASGDPINVVLIATPNALRRALLRGGWSETAAKSPLTQVARQHRYRGRIPDGTFHKARPDGSERKELRLWLAPAKYEDAQIWLGQVSYDMSGATGADAYQNYRIDPDIDDARAFLLQNLLYSQALQKMALVPGVPPSTIDNPGISFGDTTYFTDGNRAVLFLSERPVAFDDTDLLGWLESR